MEACRRRARFAPVTYRLDGAPADAEVLDGAYDCTRTEDGPLASVANLTVQDTGRLIAAPTRSGINGTDTSRSEACARQVCGLGGVCADRGCI